MKNINLILGLTASITLTGLPNTVLGHEMLDCKHCEKKIISNLDLKTPETIEGNHPIDNIVLEEKNKSLYSEILRMQNAKNSRTIVQEEETPQNGLRNFDVAVKPYQKPPSPFNKNVMKGTDIVFNNHLIL